MAIVSVIPTGRVLETRIVPERVEPEQRRSKQPVQSQCTLVRVRNRMRLRRQRKQRERNSPARKRLPMRSVGRTFEAKLDQDVAVKGNVLLKAGTKAFGRIKSSRANPRNSEPLSLELTSISVNGSNVAVKTNSVQPTGRPSTARGARHGVTVGTLRVSPGTKMQFQLAQAVTL
jgi:hypothetical protein